MRSLATALLAMLVLALVTTVQAGDLKSGLQPGDELDAFDVEKCGGAINDGKDVGTNFCYRCMLGDKPVVMIFARKADASLAKLTSELEEEIEEHEEEKLSSFVNLLGTDADALKTQAKDFAAKQKLENVAVVVPQDFENGPETYKISPEAEYTVIIYRNGKVEANHAFAPGKLDAKGVQAIISDADKMLD